MRPSHISIHDFIAQDGGIVKTIYTNALTMANLTLADESTSPELRAMTEQLKMQTEAFYKAYQHHQSDFVDNPEEEKQ